MSDPGEAVLEHMESCERCQRQEWCRDGIELARAWSDAMAGRLVPVPTEPKGERS